MSGELVLELPYGSSSLTKTEPYSQILRQGGYSNSNPFVNVNQALIGSGLAKLEQSKLKEVLPKFTVGYHVSKTQETASNDASKCDPDDQELLSDNIRRLSIKNALENL